MNTHTYNIEVTEPKTVGKTIAFVKIFMGPLWLSCRLDKSQGRYFLNPPANFVERLQGTTTKGGRTHSGFINAAGFSPEFADEVKAKVFAKLGIQEEAV